MRTRISAHNCILKDWGLWPERADLWVLVPALVAGLVTHGVMLVNKFSFHDDIYELFAPGQTFIAGRWFLGLIAKAEQVLFGTTTLSLPLLNGLIGIVLLALTADVLTRLYGLQGRSSRVLCGCAIIVMPSVVSMMGFMFTVHYYALGFLLGAIGASLLARFTTRREIASGILCIVLALGIYQAALPFVCAAMVLYLMQDVQQNMTSGTVFGKRVIRYLLEVAVAVVIYGVIALVGMRTLGGTASTTDYAGLSSVGNTGLGTYLHRMAFAYKEFLLPTQDAIYNQYPASVRTMYRILLVLLAVLILRRVVRTVRRGHTGSALQYLLLAAILPLAMNLIYVMTDVMWIHAITVYAQVILFYLVAVECEAAATSDAAAVSEPCSQPARWSIAGVTRYLTVFLAGLMMVSYVRYGNLCYLKAQFLMAEATSYFDRLITRIQSTEGYDPDMPIVFLNAQDKQADSLYDMEEFSAVITSPYNYDTLINDYAWKEYMRYWNNYDPIVYPESTDGELPQDIQEMPRYPADGSIRIFEPGYIVVKF